MKKRTQVKFELDDIMVSEAWSILCSVVSCLVILLNWKKSRWGWVKSRDFFRIDPVGKDAAENGYFVSK